MKLTGDKKLKKVLTRATGTRWFYKYDGCESLSKSWPQVKNAICKIRDNDTEKRLTRREARGYIDQIDRFEFVFMIIFWNAVLERFDKTSKNLQSVTTNLKIVVNEFRH